MKVKELVIQTRKDLSVIKGRWMSIHILFSALLTHRVWHGDSDPLCLDRTCQKVNWELQKALLTGLGHFLLNSEMQEDMPHLYHLDGIHMSVEGNDLLLRDLKQGF